MSHLEVHHAGSGGVAVAHGGLLVQRVHLQQLLVGHRLVDLVAHRVHGGLEVLVESHGDSSAVCLYSEIKVH